MFFDGLIFWWIFGGFFRYDGFYGCGGGGGGDDGGSSKYIRWFVSFSVYRVGWQAYRGKRLRSQSGLLYFPPVHVYIYQIFLYCDFGFSIPY